MQVAKPKYLTPTTPAERRRGDGLEVARFIESACRTTKDTFAGPAGKLLELRPWQRSLLDGIFARRPDGRLKHRVGLIGMPRKNGKSALTSGIALYGLFVGPVGAEVYSCAADREQARIVFGVAKRMVELDPELSSEAKLYRDAIELPASGAVYRVLSSEAFTKEGLSPTLVVYDELHAAPSDELWNVMNLGSGARIDPLILGVTTAGVRTDTTGQDSIGYRMYQHGRQVVAGDVRDPSFFFSWWEAADDSDHRDPKTWRQSNPAFGDLIDPEDFASALIRTPESEFRIKRTNQWVAGEVAWLPAGSYEALASKRQVPDGETVVLALDGSWSGDSTGIVGSTLDRHQFVVGAWEKPPDTPDWRVPIADVKDAIRTAARRWNVLEVTADPYRWSEQIQDLASEGLPMVEFPQTPARLVPACAAFYDGVMTGSLTHDGDQRLMRHVRNAVVKYDRLGPRIVKETRGSARKIDLAVCAVMADERARFHEAEPATSEPMFAWT